MTPGSPSLGALTSLSLRVGNLTFGGGDPAMLALQREMVDKRQWLSLDDFMLIWSLARATPGTNVVACFAGVGWRVAGVPGAVAAVLASTLPAAALCYWLTLAEQEWRDNEWVAAALRGVGAAVVGMMLGGAILLLRPAWRGGALTRVLPLVAASAVASHLGAPPLAVLGLAAGVGWLAAAEGAGR